MLSVSLQNVHYFDGSLRFKVRTLVKILFLARDDKTLSMLNPIEILLDRDILGMAWKAIQSKIVIVNIGK